MKKSRIVYIVGGVLAIGAVALLMNQLNTVEVRTGIVEKGMIRDVIRLDGKADLERKEKVFSKYSGIVKVLKAKEGDEVTMNTPLAQLEAPDRGVARVEIEQAQIAVGAAQKEYQHRLETYQKYKNLFGMGAISQQELKDIELQYVNSESGLKDAEQRLKLISYNSFQSGNRSVICAPISGTVMSKLVDEGMIVQPGDPLYEIGSYDSVYVRVNVLIDDMAKVKLGQAAVITGDYLNDRKITGRVFYIAPKGESSLSSLGVEQQRVEVRIRFDRTKAALKPGYNVDVDLITDEKQNAVYIPEKASFKIDGRDYVFIIKKGRLELRKFAKGIEDDNYIEAMSGLAKGEKIVIDPDNGLKPGMRVK